MSQTRTDIEALAALLESIVPKRSPKTLGEVDGLLEEIRFRYGVERFDESDLLGTATFLFRLYLRSLALRHKACLSAFNNPDSEIPDLLQLLYAKATEEERVSGEPNKKCPLRLQAEEAQRFFSPTRLVERFLANSKKDGAAEMLRAKYHTS